MSKNTAKNSHIRTTRTPKTTSANRKNSPKLVSNSNCGCLQPLGCLEDAVNHTKQTGHTVTISGNLAFQKNGLDAFVLLNSGLLQIIHLSFACGDGFFTNSLAKAVEHCAKSLHRIQVFGKINLGSEREQVERIPPPCRGALPCRSLREGARGGRDYDLREDSRVI